jgi:CRP/FNR family transcriptional regulator
MGIPEHIATVPLFQALPREHHKDLATVVKDQAFRRGQFIFSEGDEGTGFYVVISGRVKIFKLSLEGKEQILHIFGPGEPIGEVAVFAGKRFPANAEALEDSRVFFFPRAPFMELIQKNPSIALNMLAVLSQRLRKFTALIEDLSLREVPGRLAAYLLYLSQKKEGVNDLTLDISKGQLASLLGTIPETLSRILTRMTKAGLIQPEGARDIRILDHDGLEELASGDTRLH